MSYIQGFVTPVPNGRKAEYIAFAEKFWPIFQDYGALSTQECWGIEVPDGEVTSFPMAVKKTGDETVVFSWIEWRDKAAAEACMKAFDTDERFQNMGAMPFDGKRMIYGGFDPVFVR